MSVRYTQLTEPLFYDQLRVSDFPKVSNETIDELTNNHLAPRSLATSEPMISPYQSIPKVLNQAKKLKDHLIYLKANGTRERFIGALKTLFCIGFMTAVILGAYAGLSAGTLPGIPIGILVALLGGLSSFFINYCISGSSATSSKFPYYFLNGKTTILHQISDEILKIIGLWPMARSAQLRELKELEAGTSKWLEKKFNVQTKYVKSASFQEKLKNLDERLKKGNLEASEQDRLTRCLNELQAVQKFFEQCLN